MALYYCFKFKNWNLIKNDLFLYLLILYLYLLGNSIYAHYFKFYSGFEGILRSLFFIKFIFLTLSFQIILKNKILLNVVYKGWLIIILIFIFDVLFEKIFGANILGYISPDGTRIVSFSRWASRWSIYFVWVYLLRIFWNLLINIEIFLQLY